MATILRMSDFAWKGLSLHLGRRKILTLVADETYPHLYRIRYPNGRISSPANLTRAKDAAYGHARYLPAQETRDGEPYSPETTTGVEKAA